MNQKKIGIILVIVSIMMGLAFYAGKVKQDKLIDAMVESQQGSCFLPDGTCLHSEKNNNVSFIAGVSMSIALLVLGVYITFIDRTQEELMKHQKEISSALAEAKRKEDEEKRFEAFLAGFNEDEKKVLKAVRQQDGIKQSTLRFKTGLSKSMLSLVLKGLEEKKAISRKDSGKTKQVFLRNVF